MNRLEHSTSPYLRQHSHQSVEWFPWTEEAFREASMRDVPVLLSVGYSACHWCHVMSHETFDDPEVARALNEAMVAIKVDREENPDVDEAYMAAVQLATGRGGWPMTLVLTPDKRPFFAATYLAKPQFIALIEGVKKAWSEQRSEVERVANAFEEDMRQALDRDLAATTGLDPAMLDRCVLALAETFDQEHGGFGNAPKFPPHSALSFLIAYSESGREHTQTARSMVQTTLEKMARGGIHDVVGGAFQRYSTDAQWHLPHFEKMLCDNGLLAENYANAGKPDVADGIASWALNQMVQEPSLFAASLDADTEDEEGLTYTWTNGEVQSILGDRAEEFLRAFGMTEPGNFRDEATHRLTGRNVLHRANEDETDWTAEFDLLRRARQERAQPALDDKCLLGWNGLMVSGLASAGWIWDAKSCADSWLEIARTTGRWPRLVVHGQAIGDAFLEDLVFFAWGLHALGPKYRLQVGELLNEIEQSFGDRDQGGYFNTSERHENRFGRTKTFTDGSLPSPIGILARLLVRHSRYEQAGRCLEAGLGWMERAPTATESMHQALLEYSIALQGAPHVFPSWTPGKRGEAELRLVPPEGWKFQDPPTLTLEVAEVKVERSTDLEYSAFVTMKQGIAQGSVRWQLCTERECLNAQERPVRLAL